MTEMLPLMVERIDGSADLTIEQRTNGRIDGLTDAWIGRSTGPTGWKTDGSMDLRIAGSTDRHIRQSVDGRAQRSIGGSASKQTKGRTDVATAVDQHETAMCDCSFSVHVRKA